MTYTHIISYTRELFSRPNAVPPFVIDVSIKHVASFVKKFILFFQLEKKFGMMTQTFIDFVINMASFVAAQNEMASHKVRFSLNLNLESIPITLIYQIQGGFEQIHIFN